MKTYTVNPTERVGAWEPGQVLTEEDVRYTLLKPLLDSGAIKENKESDGDASGGPK